YFCLLLPSDFQSLGTPLYLATVPSNSARSGLTPYRITVCRAHNIKGCLHSETAFYILLSNLFYFCQLLLFFLSRRTTKIRAILHVLHTTEVHLYFIIFIRVSQLYCHIVISHAKIYISHGHLTRMFITA